MGGFHCMEKIYYVLKYFVDFHKLYLTDLDGNLDNSQPILFVSFVDAVQKGCWQAKEIDWYNQFDV